MNIIVLQNRIRRQGCVWKDYRVYSFQNELKALDAARTELIAIQPGGVFAECPSTQRRDWRVIVRETKEHVIEEYVRDRRAI
jgi:hypothetical protein